MANLTILQGVVLAGLCAACWPVSTALLCLNYVILAISRRKALRALVRRMPGFKARNVLITGSSPYALRLARAFHETGHHVSLAATQTSLLPLHVRWSVAVRKYIQIKHTPTIESYSEYAQELLTIIQKEAVELWIDCSKDTPALVLAQAKSIITQKTDCVCFVPDTINAMICSKPSTFLKFAADNGLPVPESYEVKTRNEIHKILHQSNGKRKYILSDGDTNGTVTPRSSTLLPRRTLSQTYDEVSRVKILKNSSLRLDQTPEGSDLYRSTAIIVNGKVKTFVACALTDSRVSTIVNPSSALNIAIMHFVSAFATKLDSYSGHLTIDFAADERPNVQAVEKRILPMAGRATIDAPILLFTGLQGSIALVRGYVSVFGRSANGFISGDDEISTPVIQPGHERGVYSFGSALYTLLLLPMLDLLTLRTNLFYVLGAAIAFVKHFSFWQEALYDFKDPLPSWYFYQVYVPARLVFSVLTGTMRNLTTELAKLMA